jgi:hypothetical protein
MRLKVLVEGSSDVPVVEEALQRKCGLRRGHDFAVIEHRGKGRLPASGSAPQYGKLLDELPRTLRGLSEEEGLTVLVLVDADEDDCRQLKGEILRMHEELKKKPKLLVRIAMVETESWLIADTDAVLKAYPDADVEALLRIAPDQPVGAWEALAKAVGRDPTKPSVKRKKKTWCSRIAPYLNLDAPPSPSLRVFLRGVEAALGVVSK